jgi:hypothetical protein
MGARGRFGSQLWGGGMSTKHDDATMENQFSDVTLDELREFLEADIMDVNADPAFKERLRKKLWELVQAQSGSPYSREGKF